MARSGRVLAPKYTPKVVPMPVVVPASPPQAGASVCIPTIPVGEPASSMLKGTFSNSAEATTSRGKEVINEKEQVEKVINAEEGQEFLKLIKRSDLKIVDQLS